MRKLIIVCLVLNTVCLSLRGEETVKKDSSWSLSGMSALTLSQVSLSNWSAGGEDAIGFNVQFAYNADYKKAKHLWQNRLELAYGLNRTETDGAKKTNDKIYISSTYGYGLTKSLYVSSMVSFNSQFAKGYDYKPDPRVLISRFMAPGYLMGGLGLTWNPKVYFTATLSAISWRGTFVTSDVLSEQGAYGVKPGEHLFSEMGGNLKLEVNYEFMKNMTIYSWGYFFSNYLEDTKNVDVRWDVLLNMKVNKWFSANISTNMIYDNDTKIVQKDGSKGPRLQFKEVLGVGFQVNF